MSSELWNASADTTSASRRGVSPDTSCVCTTSACVRLNRSEASHLAPMARAWAGSDLRRSNRSGCGSISLNVTPSQVASLPQVSISRSASASESGASSIAARASTIHRKSASVRSCPKGLTDTTAWWIGPPHRSRTVPPQCSTPKGAGTMCFLLAAMATSAASLAKSADLGSTATIHLNSRTFKSQWGMLPRSWAACPKLSGRGSG